MIHSRLNHKVVAMIGLSLEDCMPTSGQPNSFVSKQTNSLDGCRQHLQFCMQLRIWCNASIQGLPHCEVHRTGTQFSDDELYDASEVHVVVRMRQLSAVDECNHCSGTMMSNTPNEYSCIQLKSVAK